jgi:hypothetical protein
MLRLVFASRSWANESIGREMFGALLDGSRVLAYVPNRWAMERLAAELGFWEPAEVVEACARTLTLCAVADAVDNGEASSELDPGPGGDWDDSVPAGFPHEALWKAQEIVADLEERNGSSLDWLVSDWTEASGLDGERFGHCLALQALGHGVGLDDDVPASAGYKRPETGYFEFFDLGDFLR